MLQWVWKQHLRPRAVVGYGVKIFLPSPPNYVTRSPGGGRTVKIPSKITEFTFFWPETGTGRKLGNTLYPTQDKYLQGTQNAFTGLCLSLNHSLCLTIEFKLNLSFEKCYHNVKSILNRQIFFSHIKNWKSPLQERLTNCPAPTQPFAKNAPMWDRAKSRTQQIPFQRSGSMVVDFPSN